MGPRRVSDGNGVKVLDQRDGVLRLVANFDEDGVPGAFRLIDIDLDSLTVEDWGAPTPGVGGICVIGGQPYDYTFPRPSPTAVPDGVRPGPTDLVPISYDLVTYSEGRWEPVPDGSFDGPRPRNELLRCAGDGYAGTATGDPASVLTFTPGGGWQERSPDTADLSIDAGSAVIATPSLRPVAGLALGLQIQLAPGVWEPLVARSGGVALPTTPGSLDVSPTTVAYCTLIADDQIDRCETLP